MVLAQGALASNIGVAVNRSHLLTFSSDMAEVIIANPEIADVHNHGKRKLSVIGKGKGQTSLRVFDINGNAIGEYVVVVGLDLPAIRRALKQFLPSETIGVEMVNTNVALTGKVSSALVVEKSPYDHTAILSDGRPEEGAPASSNNGSGEGNYNRGLINLLQVTSGQQVMLRVRVGEVNRTALKQLGIEWANFGTPGNYFWNIAKDTGQNAFVAGSTSNFIVDTSEALTSFGFGWESGGSGINALIKALEQDNLFKLLAEPNLVAISGEEAEFLAGGEIPVPVPQPTGETGGLTQITVEFKLIWCGSEI